LSSVLSSVSRAQAAHYNAVVYREFFCGINTGVPDEISQAFESWFIPKTSTKDALSAADSRLRRGTPKDQR
jgi:hypothetical protein